MPCPPSRAEAPSFFSSPAAATPCRPPLRSASITCRPIPGRPGSIPEALFRDEQPRFVADVSRVVRGAHRISRHAARPARPARADADPDGGAGHRLREAAIAAADEPGRRRSGTPSRSRSIARMRAARPICRPSSASCFRPSRATSRRRRCPRGWRCSASARTACSAPTAPPSGCTIGAPAMVVLSASSDVVYLAQERRIPTADASRARSGGAAPRACRNCRVGTTHGGAPTATVTVPLKGRRRALGTLVMEGCGSSRDRRWTCSSAPTRWDGSSRPRSKMCCCSTPCCDPAASSRTRSTRSPISWPSPTRTDGSSR